MEFKLAGKDDLHPLLKWCEDAPEFQKNLPSYLEDREDTTVLMMEDESEIKGLALLKVMETDKTGSIWLHLKDEGKESHPDIMQESLKWLRRKGAKEYTII